MLKPTCLALSACVLTTLATSQSTSGTFVESGVGCPAQSATDTNSADDEVIRNLALGFTFPYVGGIGSTTAIDISSNGYVHLEPGTVADSRCCTANLLRFSNEAPSIAAFGNDLSPDLGRGLFYETDGATVATVTWLQVPEFASNVPFDVQVRLFNSGVFELSYRNTAATRSGNMLVGYSPGNGAIDNGSQDLSAIVFGASPLDMIYEVFAPGGPYDLDGSTLSWIPNGSGSYDVVLGPSAWVDPVFPLDLGIDLPPNIGRSTTLSVSDLPANTIASALLFGTTPVSVPLDVLGMTGCSLHVNNVFTSVPMTISGDRATFPLAIASDPGNIGTSLVLQGAAIAPGVNPFGVALSEQGVMTIGRDPTLIAVAEGRSSADPNNAAGGYFRVEYGAGSGMPDIESVVWDLTTCTSGRVDFDTDGTTGNEQFDSGNGTLLGCMNTYVGSDIVTGLVYGAPGQGASRCDPAAFTGWVGSNPGTGTEYYGVVTFDFADFQQGETFGFSCDTDFPSPNLASGHIGGTITVNFVGGTSVSGQLAATGSSERAEVILIP